MRKRVIFILATVGMCVTFGAYSSGARTMAVLQESVLSYTRPAPPTLSSFEV